MAALGMIWGAGAEAAGIGRITAIVMSATVFSGAAQFAALPLWRDSAVVLVLSTLVLSLRFVLMTVSLAPALGSHSTLARAGLAFGILDENYALSVVRRGGRPPASYLIGSWIGQYTAWLGGSIVGVLVGAQIPPAWLGPLESVFPIFFVAVTVLVCTSPTATVVALLGAGLSALGALVVPGGWNVVVAGVAASLVGVALAPRAK